MKESVAWEYATARLDDPEGVEVLELFHAAIGERSQILWGEHCSECDHPRCYSTCALYSPRADLQCRRFEAGIEAASSPSAPGLMRIRFRRWGKLEGAGPAMLIPEARARRRERNQEHRDGLQTRLPLPFAAAVHLSWRRSLANARPPRKHRAPEPGDAFVIEGWALSGAAKFTLTFLQDDASRLTWCEGFELGAICRRFAFAVAKIATTIDLTKPYRVQIEPVGEAEGVDAVFALADFVAAGNLDLAEDEAAAPKVKALVWDLDQTLWDGVLGEDGVEGVKIRPQAVRAIKALDERGVLQSIASKNDPAEALAALRRFELDCFFLHPQISWGPKSEAVAAIAAALDIGLDTIAFVDDQAFERAEVSTRLAGVRTLPETAVGELTRHPWFDHPRTAESGARRSLYAAEAARVAARDAGIGEYVDFLRASRISLEIRPLGESDIERAFELSQRTNQLNFTGEKFSRGEVHALLADPGVELLVLNCADRFGDYGMIGLAIVDLEGGELSRFFMSCRVQRRRVECAFFAFLAKRLRALGRQRMWVRFQATERNGAASMMLRELGFRQGETDSSGSSRWERPLRAPFKDADVVRLAGEFGKAA